MTSPDQDPRLSLQGAVEADLATIMADRAPTFDLQAQIDALHREELGRAIVHVAGKVERVVGYALPLDTSGLTHILIFKDGNVLQTIPKSEEDEDVSRYKSMLEPTTSPFRYSGEYFTNISNIVLDFALGNDTFKNKTVARNTTVESSEALERLAVQAIIYSRSYKEERQRARDIFASRLRSDLETPKLESGLVGGSENEGLASGN